MAIYDVNYDDKRFKDVENEKQSELNKYNDTYDVYVGSYTYKEGALKIYTADLSSAFNKNYVSDESNLYVSNVDDIKFSKSTLIKISNGQVVEAYEGHENIVAHLNSIVK